MAIVQISKIIHRTGANTDLPQLDIGEIGFATDEQRVYIGNDPNIVPPAFVGATTQTEILTTESPLDFSRINGSSNATMNISSPVNGQLMGLHVAGSTTTLVNVGANGGGLISLGNVGNVKLNGGVNGYLLQTDGAGNLTWTAAPAGTPGSGSTGGANTQIQFNDAGNFGGSPNFTFNKTSSLLTVSGNIAASNISSNVFGYFDGRIGFSTPNIASFTSVIINNNANVTGMITAATIVANTNGTGENFKVGDDLWIGDINTADTMQLKGVEDSANAYIVFGDSDTTALGRSGTGPLTYGGDMEITGNIISSGVELNTGSNTWSMFANVDGIFCTDNLSGNIYQVNLTQV